MDRTMSREALSELLDRVTREITQEAGVVLRRTGENPSVLEGEVCTVFITFDRGMDTSLSVCGDASLFSHLTQAILQSGEFTPQDVEDVSKEYLNVLCGHILSRLFQATKQPARFGVPSFCWGRHEMEGTEKHIVLNYTGDQNERVQLVHHVPHRESGARPESE